MFFLPACLHSAVLVVHTQGCMNPPRYNLLLQNGLQRFRFIPAHAHFYPLGSEDTLRYVNLVVVAALTAQD